MEMTEERNWVWKENKPKNNYFFVYMKTILDIRKAGGGTEKQRGAGDRKKQDQKMGWTEEGMENRIRDMSLKRQKTEFQVDLKD